MKNKLPRTPLDWARIVAILTAGWICGWLYFGRVQGDDSPDLPRVPYDTSSILPPEVPAGP